MSQTIDKRIVEMAFENDKFEKGVGTSLGTIDKLKKSLNFDNASKSLSGITDAARGVNLSSIADGVGRISSGFSALGIVAITTLVNMTNAAIQAGLGIARALTIDPIKAGLNEYETKLNSIQTILANTEKEGTTLKTVTNALNELNEYSDKTIYNFQQMTRNVGTFTAAGVKLDSSVAAIKGIANLAAISGSNADQASTAMYQLSQALSSGSVKLMDWNSVVNAGMGGQVFQEAIKETARVHGVAIDDMIKQDGSFRETLQRGWFTSEILTETLSKFTGDLNAEQLKTMGYTEQQIASILKMGQTANDAATKVKTFTQLFDTLKEAAQSGWAQTWEIILGDFEEAKKFFTEANNILGGMLGASADARNAVLQAWKDLGGRESLIQAVRNTFEGVLSVIKPIKEALTDIFPSATGQQLFNLTKGLETLTEKFKMGGEGAEKLKTIFKGIFAIVDIFRMGIVALGKVIFGLTGNLGGPIESFTDFLVLIANIIIAFRDGIKATNGFGKAFEAIGKVLSSIVTVVGKFFASFKDGLGSFKGINLDGLKTFMNNLTIKFEPLKKLGELMGKFIKLIGTLVSKIAPIAMAIGDKVATGVGSFIDRITLALEHFEPERVFDIINGGLLGGVLLAIRKFISKGSGMFDGVKGILDGVKGSLEAWQTSLKADVLLKIAASLGILALSVIALSMVDSKKLTFALGAMTIMFVQLGVSLSAFQTVSSSINPLAMAKMSVGLLAISSAMLIMSLAVAKLGQMNSKELVKGMMALTTLIGVVKLASASLANSSGKMITGAFALIIFSVAIHSLGMAVKKLGDMDTDSLTKGLIGVGVLVGELAIFMRVTNLSGLGIIKSVGILILAAAISSLASTVKKLSEIDTDSIFKGLAAMGLIFAELYAFVTLTGGGTTLIITAAGIGIIALSMGVLGDVLEKLGKLSWEEVAKGLTAMAGALVLIGAAAYLIPPTLIITAAGLVVVAGALVILAEAMTIMGGMTWDEVARGIAVLGGSLLIIAFALNVMSGTLMGSAALFVAAAALAVLAPALKTLGSMSWEEIGRGLVALAGAFVVLGIAGMVMTPVIPTLLGLGVAMLIIGVAMAAAGVGLLAFSAGLAALSVSGAAGAAALVVIISSIVGLVPMLVKTLGRAILALVDVLVEGAPTLLKGIVTFLNILLDGLLEVIPKIVDVVITLVDTLLTKLAEHMPSIVQAGYDILIAFLEGVRANIGEVVTLSFDIIELYLNGIAARIPDIVDSGWKLIIAWVDGLKAGIEENLPTLMDSVRELGLAIIKGLITGLIEGQGDARDAIKEIGKIIINGFKEYLGIHSPSSVFMGLALDIIKGLILGFTNNVNLVRTEALNMAKKVVDAIKEKYNDMVSAGKNLVTGFANGITQYVSQAIESAKALANAVINTVKNVLDSHSPSRVLFEQGKFADQGLANGITQFSSLVVGSVENVGKEAISGFTNVVSQIADTLNTGIDLNPTIRPVLDLTSIEKGGSQIQGLLGINGLNPTVSMIQAAKINTNPTTPDGATINQPADKPSVVQFTQNNYSPKELARIDIYRQTRNQLLQAKGLTGV